MAHVIDTEAAQKIQVHQAAEESAAQYAKWVMNYDRMSKFVIGRDISPLDNDFKQGTVMHSNVLEQRLLKLNPNLIFAGGDFNTTHKRILHTNQEHPLHDAPIVYPIGNMPERSVLEFRDEWVPDPNYKTGDQDYCPNEFEWVPVPGYEEYYRADAWKYEELWNDPKMLERFPWLPFCGEWERIHDNAGRAGWKKVRTFAAEKTRGWRTVLLKLVKVGVLTPQQVERAFHSDDTPEWKGHIGKGQVTSPW